MGIIIHNFGCYEVATNTPKHQIAPIAEVQNSMFGGIWRFCALVAEKIFPVWIHEPIDIYA
jgi:hypothetical protein